MRFQLATTDPKPVLKKGSWVLVLRLLEFWATGLQRVQGVGVQVAPKPEFLNLTPGDEA